MNTAPRKSKPKPKKIKVRSDDQTTVTVSMERALVQQIDVRIGALKLSRSKYLAVLASADLEKGGGLIIPPQASGGTSLSHKE